MIEINITKKEIEKTYKKVCDEFIKVTQALQKQIKQYESKNNLKISNQSKMNYFNNNFSLFNASILETIIKLVINKINKLFVDKKIKLNEDQKICLIYFTDIIANHLKVLRDFEFFNIAMLAKYLLEASSAILENKKNFKNFFKELTYEEYVERFEKKHQGISKQIEEHLGNIAKKLYKDSNVYSHPIQGTSFGLGLPNQFMRNNRCLSILLTTYYVVINKVFNIFDINFNLDFFFEVAKNSEQINKNFKDYLNEK